MELVKYEAACRALAAACSVDEVREISGRAEAARAYARQVKNKGLEIDALEIRVRAERRLGEIIKALKVDQTIRVGGPGRGHHDAPITTLKDLGIDHNISGVAQRLASLPEHKFVVELADWRSKAETSQRMENPLQVYRLPTIKSDRQKAAARKGRVTVNTADPLDRFRSADGRRIADWRTGELDRLEDLFSRALKCVEVLRENMPAANPDPLATMEMVFDSKVLGRLLAAIWDEGVRSSDAGLNNRKRAG